MDALGVFHEKLQLGYYNGLCEPADAARCQESIRQFMTLIEDNTIQLRRDMQLLKDFCNLVDHDDVWHLAAMVIPQFRLSKAEKYSLIVSRAGFFSQIVQRRRP